MVNSCPELILKYLDIEPNEFLSSPENLRVGNRGSLSISIGEEFSGYWYSYETGDKGDMVDIIMKELSLKEKDALDLGYSIVQDGDFNGCERLPSSEQQENHQQNTAELAEQIRKEATELRGTIAEYYLKHHRGLNDIPGGALFFHHGLLTRTKAENYIKVPALVALASHPSSPSYNIQVTYLDPHSGNKHPDVAVQRRTYGSFKSGDCQHICSLNEGDVAGSDVTYVSEGVETGLSLYQVDPDSHILATLGKHNFTRLDPALLHRKVVLIWDNDGIPINKDKILRATVNNLKRSGKEDVYLLYPPATESGSKVDLNDTLRDRGREGVEEVLRKHLLKIQLD